MKKNEFDNVLHQIRTVTKKYGNDDVLVYRKDITTVVISNKLWVYKVECSVGALIQLTKVGFFMFDDRDEYNDFLAQKNDTIELKLNITLLIDKYNVKKMTAILPNVLLIGGIITLLISLFMYITASQTSGFASYSRFGNSLSDSESMNWFHVFIIGVGLILFYIISKLYDHFSKE